MSYTFTLLVLVAVAYSHVVAGSDEKAKTNNCDCGVFKWGTPHTTSDSPAASMAHNFAFACNAEEKEQCSKMCQSLAQAARENGPQKLCEYLGTTEEKFKPLLFYRACDDKDWTYTGMESTLEVCCKDKQAVACA